jgi:hypothetical protein
MGREWGRAIGTVPRTPQAPDHPLLGGAARDYVETISPPSGTADWWHNKKKYIYIYYKNNIKNEIILLIIYNIILIVIYNILL